jgi:hypothetical protein
VQFETKAENTVLRLAEESLVELAFMIVSDFTAGLKIRWK